MALCIVGEESEGVRGYGWMDGWMDEEEVGCAREARGGAKGRGWGGLRVP